jgi:hypothetical protein
MVAIRILVAALVVAVIAGCAPLALLAGVRVPPAPVEPPAAAAFIAAHAATVAVTPPPLSPLYAVESIRRGRGADALDGLWLEAAPRLRFELLAWLAGERGFGHALYLARPKERPGPTTVWRIDLDPRGRVIWAEPVRLLRTAVSVERSSDGVAVVTAEGDGYVALPRPDGRGFRFLIADADGSAVDDPWSFGRLYNMYDAEGHALTVPPLSPTDPSLDRDARALLADYLEALR